VLERTTTGGYANRVYAESFSEWATPRLLPQSEAWILERSVPKSPYHDAMGCYPLFVCPDWSKLREDLDLLEGKLVTLSLVTDPFGGYDYNYLTECFPDRMTQFKLHFVADLQKPIDEIVSKHHRYYAAKALANITVEKVTDPIELLDDWVTLYDNLTARHALTGIKAFSKAAFAIQLRVPGLVMLRAVCGSETVGMHLWYVDGEVAQSHLAALNRRGYELMASYALYWSAIEVFAGTVRWLNFGAGAGTGAAKLDGLTRFKQGWATETRPSYFCGRIFDHKKYLELSEANKNSSDRYFPAYRAGEFS